MFVGFTKLLRGCLDRTNLFWYSFASYASFFCLFSFHRALIKFRLTFNAVLVLRLMKIYLVNDLNLYDPASNFSPGCAVPFLTPKSHGSFLVVKWYFFASLTTDHRTCISLDRTSYEV